MRKTGLVTLLSLMLFFAFACRPVPSSLSQAEKEEINREFFSDSSFHELSSLPEYLEQQLTIVPIRSYQKDQNLYFITSANIHAQDTEHITNLRENPSYGGCSEIWMWEIPTEKLQKCLVKFDHYVNPLLTDTKTLDQNWLGTSYGSISTISDILENGDIVFTESIAEGMMNFTLVEYRYHIASDTITIADFQPGRPEIYTPEELQNMKEKTVNSDTLSLFRAASDILWEHREENKQWSFFTRERWYVVQYNLKASKKARGKYYHEIGFYSLTNSSYRPLVRKWITELDKDPFISLELVPDSMNLSIRDWCGFSGEARTNQSYYYDAEEGSINWMKEASNTTPETGIYEVVLD
jgi:hypothetical protein